MSTRTSLALAIKSLKITKKNLEIQSTLNNIGWKKVNILVNKDMVLSPCNERG